MDMMKWKFFWVIEDDETSNRLETGFEEVTATNDRDAEELVYGILEDKGYDIGSSNVPYNVQLFPRGVMKEVA